MVEGLFVILIVLALMWLMWCDCRMFHQRNLIVETMIRRSCFTSFIGAYNEVSRNKHLLYLLTFRDPFRLYPPEMRP